MRVAGKVAIVTGAGSGIGAACATTLSREGARVTLADIDPAGGERVAHHITSAGGCGSFFATDVTSTDDVRALIEHTMSRFGRLDILISNAGIAVRKTVTDQDEEGWERCLRVNLTGVYLCARFAIPHMMAEGGSIVNTSSVTGIVGVRNRAAYTAAKGAIVALTRNMALDYAGHQIRVNCICPGFTRTPLAGPLLADPLRERTLIEMHPLGRLGTVDDIANAVLFLSSDESSWITGHALVVDGGFSVGKSADI